MPAKRSEVSSQFKEVLRKIKSGELPKVSDAEIERYRQRWEQIRIFCQNCDCIGVAEF